MNRYQIILTRPSTRRGHLVDRVMWLSDATSFDGALQCGRDHGYTVRLYAVDDATAWDDAKADAIADLTQ